MTRKKTSPVPVEERQRVVLSALGGQMTMAGAARRHDGVADATVAKWRDRFLEAGKASLADGIPGPGSAHAVAERRLRAENEQLKRALAEQMVQLRIWQKGAELASRQVIWMRPGKLAEQVGQSVPQHRHEVSPLLRQAGCDQVTHGLVAGRGHRLGHVGYGVEAVWNSTSNGEKAP